MKASAELIFASVVLGISVAGPASADVVDEFGSQSGWASHVTHETDYQFSGASGQLSVFPSLTFGPGTFTTPGNATVLYNDGLYGNGVQYVSASPDAFGETGPATVVVKFSATADLTALAFTVGSGAVGSDIAISVNGSALAPLTVSTASPTAFLGVTDTSHPITSITFTDSNFQYGGYGELDLINSFTTASAVVAAPELDPGSAAGGLALLLGSAATLRGRRRRPPSDRLARNR